MDEQPQLMNIEEKPPDITLKAKEANQETVKLVEAMYELVGQREIATIQSNAVVNLTTPQNCSSATITKLLNMCNMKCTQVQAIGWKHGNINVIVFNKEDR